MLIATSILTLFLAADPGCTPADTITLKPSLFNQVAVCARTPKYLCGVTYALTGLSPATTITGRYSDYRTFPGYDLTQPVPVPFQGWEAPNDWGYTLVPAVWPITNPQLVEIIDFTTTTPDVLKLTPYSVAVFDTSPSCGNAFDVPADGKIRQPWNLQLR